MITPLSGREKNESRKASEPTLPDANWPDLPQDTKDRQAMSVWYTDLKRVIERMLTRQAAAIETLRKQ